MKVLQLVALGLGIACASSAMAGNNTNPQKIQNICTKTTSAALKHNPNDATAQKYAAQCKTSAPSGTVKGWSCAHYLVSKGDSMSTALQNCKISNS